MTVTGTLPLTLDELRECESKEIPVVIIDRDTPGSQLLKQIGIIHSISENPTEHSTYQEPSCWITLRDGIRVFVWAHQIRKAHLRKPFKIHYNFIHTSSNKYSGDDREAS